jgi:hypothetical protein
MTLATDKTAQADQPCRAGEKLAGSNLTLRIGDIRFTMASQSLDLLLEVPSSARQFLVDSEVAADCVIQARWGAVPETVPGSHVFDSGYLWRQYSDGSEQVFRFQTSRFGPMPYKECRVREDFRQAEVVLHRDYLDWGQPVYPLEYPLDEILMLNLLSQSGGVEVHSCGIEDEDGRGYLFLGQSGAGKTTSARLWDSRPGVRILSDDRIILRYLDGCLWMYGTPWHGEGRFARPARTRLNHIFFLGRGAVNSVRPMAAAETVARLMSCSFLPYHNRSGLDFTISFLQQVTEAVPCLELRFVPDEHVVDFVRQTV